MAPATGLALLCILGIPGIPALHAADPADAAWREFQHALGEPAAIGAHADHPLADTAFRPIPAVTLQDINAPKFQLGNDLFHERRLSADNSIACITCHAGPVSGTDGRVIAVGVNRALGNFNALTTFNAAFNFRQFWDGRSVTLADQAVQPIINEIEMANTLDAALAMLQADASYLVEFQRIYPDGLTINNMADAMAHFQRMSFTVADTPFQRHLNGEADQLSEQALRGWQHFQDIGCSSCHNGINLGGNSYQRLGALRPYFPERRQANANDAGLAGRSHRQQDLHAFKVPSLHSAAMTVPYFHDGSVPTLAAAIIDMAVFQLDRELAQQEVDDIAAFIRALNGRPAGLALSADISRLARDAESSAGSQHSTGAPATHHQAYQATAAAILPAFEQLLVEMQKLDSGAVAHFDFIQFQHLELIRHARALQHPPSTLPPPVRSALINQADKLLTEVMNLEWSIADFLQAQAMIAVLTAQQRTPGPRSPTPEVIATKLISPQTTARQSLAETSASKVPSLAVSFDAL